MGVCRNFQNLLQHQNAFFTPREQMKIAGIEGLTLGKQRGSFSFFCQRSSLPGWNTFLPSLAVWGKRSKTLELITQISDKYPIR